MVERNAVSESEARQQDLGPGGEDTTVFTMTIRSTGQAVVRTTKSHPGEKWEDTLHRLYHEGLPPDEPRRRVVFMTYHESEVGSPTNLVIMGSDGPDSGERQNVPLFITTDPPQF
jgi:hypothetical protein